MPDVLEIQGICIGCNLGIPSLMKMYVTKDGEQCDLCHKYKGQMTDHICKRCSRNWKCHNANCKIDIHVYCPDCLLQGFEKLMRFEEDNK